MATTADIKIGMCIELDGKTFQIVDFQHVKPGKGPAFVRTKLKNLENGRVLETGVGHFTLPGQEQLPGAA